MTLYDINKSIVSQLPSKTTNGQLKEYKELISSIQENAGYFMLLCNDIRYYTVIARTGDHSEQTFANTVIELLQEQGEIKLIDWNNEKHEAIECWIQKDNETIMFMLFDYDWGIVECQ